MTTKSLRSVPGETHVTSRDCRHCGGEIEFAVQYEVDAGTVLILNVEEPVFCPHCGKLTDGPNGRAFMLGLQAEIKADLRLQDDNARDAARARLAAPWD